ncbi:uncharacterized protein Triagg1_2013 [Trichoderma aggressivum f. europaeum]|uniref:SAP domain-containing protein n=1 Tax=Trichoderma aggressivum f. europaeum TaxID=173218 RepID=A0AAE1M3F3_9HYPO|nr:hypothetical protein Triagg1_2013 [Trichoderma aggressivum f. europaeum]
MADYTALKVPELKKLLAEKKLPQTGNKADLIARLQEDDKKNATASATEADKPVESKEDEINYSDDEPAAASKPEKEQAAKPAEKPAAEPAAAAAPADEDEAKPAEESGDKPAAEEAEAKEPAPSFAIGLSSTTADEELRKRVERAKRFGTELDDETKRLAERAKRFGVDDKELATGLDSALPERPLKRGRGRNEGDGNGPGKRRSQDRREQQQPSGNERRSGRNKGNQNQGGKAAGKPKFSSVIEDPAEKAKAEKRAARFAAA